MLDLVREYGPDEFREQLEEASTPDSQRISEEMAFMLAAGGEIGGG